jgi:hypothetical protein
VGGRGRPLYVRWWGWVRRSSFVVHAPAPAVVAATPFLSLLLPLLLLSPPSFPLPLPLLPLVLPLPFLLPLLLPLPPLLRSHSHSCYCCRRRCWFCCCCSHSRVRASSRVRSCRPHPVTLVGLRSRSFALVLCLLVCLAFVRVRSCSFVLFWAGGALCLLSSLSFMSTSSFTKLVNT